MTTPPKHRSPSKDRYAANHPAITVHFDLDTYKRLIALRDATGWSLNELVRAALDSLEAQVATILERGRREGVTEGKKIGEAAGRKTGYDEGWKVGYLKAQATFRLTYPCHVCGKPVAVRVGAPDAKHAIEVRPTSAIVARRHGKARDILRARRAVCSVQRHLRLHRCTRCRRVLELRHRLRA
jgi:hypothetical protein